MGEYLVLLFDEAKRRPLCLFKQTPASRQSDAPR